MSRRDVPRFIVHLYPQIDTAHAQAIDLAIQLGEEGGGFGDVAIGAAPLYADALAEQLNFYFFVSFGTT